MTPEATLHGHFGSYESTKMFKLTVSLPALLVLAACNGPVVAQNDTDETVETQPSNATECSIKARKRYLDGSRTAGMVVDENADPPMVIAGTQTQKEKLAVLYKRQLDDLAACSNE